MINCTILKVYLSIQINKYIFVYNKIILMSEPVYFREYMNVKELGSNKQLTWSGKRGKLTKKFGWTIPNEQVIEFLTRESKESPLFEIGAGNGYLSYEIQNNGGNTVPIDIATSRNEWVEVQKMSYENLNPKNVSHIILPWPPANSSMGEECIRYLNPDVVYFIGKDESNVTGTKKFHKILQKKYTCSKKLTLPSWTDKPTVFKKYIT